MILLVERLSTEQIELTRFLRVIVPTTKHMRGRPSGGKILAVSQSIRKNYAVIYKSDQVIAIVFRRHKIAIIVSYLLTLV